MARRRTSGAYCSWRSEWVIPITFAAVMAAVRSVRCSERGNGSSQGTGQLSRNPYKLPTGVAMLAVVKLSLTTDARITFALFLQVCQQSIQLRE